MLFKIYPTSRTASLRSSGVIAGSYTNTDITVNSSGVIIDAKNGSSGSANLLIDESSPPTTSINQGGIFVSNGSSSSTIKNRIYYRNESNGIIKELSNPSNQVIITKVADFPVPSSNIINLDPTKIYIISGTVDISPNRIVGNGPIYIEGKNKNLDQIIANTPDPIITQASNQIVIKNLTFLNNNTNLVNKILSYDGMNTNNANVVIENITILGNSNINSKFGTIRNSKFLYINNIEFNNLGDGLILDNTNNSVIISDFYCINPNPLATSFNALTILPTAIIEDLYIHGGKIDLATSQTGLNIATAATISHAPARVSNLFFTGTGNNLTGIDKTRYTFDFFQNFGIVNSITLGLLTLGISPTNIEITTQNSYGDLATSSLSSIYTFPPENERFKPGNLATGQLNYKGTQPITVKISISLSLESSIGNNQNIGLKIMKDSGSGFVDVPNSEFLCTAGTNPVIGTTQAYSTLNPNDKIKPQIKNITSSNDLVLYYANISITDLAI